MAGYTVCIRQSLTSAARKLSCSCDTVTDPVLPTSSQSIDYAEVKSWSQSLGRLLQNAIGVTMLKRFLQQEHSAENLEFWLAVEKFRKIAQNKNDALLEEAERIFTTHICLESATAEISLDMKTRANIEKSLDDVTRQIFDEAQKQVWASLERDNYPRFVQSELYTDFLLRQITLQHWQRWLVNFDDMMLNEEGRLVFKRFLAKEKAQENVRFWEAVQLYNRIGDADQRKMRAREIYQQFVSISSKTEISIDHETRAQIREAYAQADAHIFDRAANHVYGLMKNDSYRRFVKSDIILKYAAPPQEGDAKKQSQQTTRTNGN